MNNIEEILSKILLVAVPFGCFMFIVKYKERFTHTYNDEKLDEIEMYLIDYFSLTNEEIHFDIKEDHYYLQADSFPVETIGNINVYVNDFPFGSLSEYFLDDRKNAYDVYLWLVSKCKRLKVPHNEKKSYVSLFTTLDKYMNIQDEDIKESIFQLQNALNLLVKDKRMDERFYRYMMILFDILERYQKLESVNQIDEIMLERTKNVVQKVTRIISEKAYSEK